MGISRGRPKTATGPFVKVWPRKWDGRKTFLRIISLDPNHDNNWFQTHYDREAGGTVPCLDGCHYCKIGKTPANMLYCPAVLYVVLEPGPLICLELRETAGIELEKMYRPGLLVEAMREQQGMVLRPCAGQAGLPPLPRPFDVLATLKRIWGIAEKGATT